MGGTTLKRELTGIALLLLALFLAGAIGALGVAEARSAQDIIFLSNAPIPHAVRSSVGAVGWYLAWPLVRLLGWTGASLLPLAMAVHALRLFGRLESDTDRSWLVFLLGMAALLPVAVGVGLALPEGVGSASAGLWGGLVAALWRSWFGGAGAWVALLFALSALMAATLAWNPIRALVGHRPAAGPAAARGLVVAGAGELIEASIPKRRRRKANAEAGGDPSAIATMLEPSPEEMPALDLSLLGEGAATPAAVEVVEPDGARGRRKRERKATPELPLGREERIVAEIESTAVAPGDGVVQLPAAELLARAPERNGDAGERKLDDMGRRLIDALRTFRVDAEIGGRTTGPVVTQFEVVPAAGVKVRQIANLSNDLALAIKAPSIRIVAPIPGKGAVGVEVPNPNPEIVSFRELIEAPDFRSARAALPIALGKDLEGKPVIADLAKMPHLLIAGATGSGKSVCVNTIITSLVYRHTPKTLRFLMVDPKMVELSVYNDLPHLRHKVVTDNRDAAAVLKWAVMEMNERYELLAANGCRNLQDFNKRVRDGVPLQTPRNPDVAFEDRTYKRGELPYIVAIIDEMADLMMTVQGEVETPIAMLAQKARAIGIHLILATQRPSVNVITGLIKANFPSRIAFRVASQVDSRTIIDGAGAEMLLGNGDMLFIPPGKSEPARLQGAYLSSEETERLMGWYRDAKAGTSAAARELAGAIDASLEEPDILQLVRDREALESGKGGEDAEALEGDRDKLFRDAAECVIQHQHGSTSLLQRRLKIGYGRAARIIDQLHLAGVLSPPDGSKPRDVLVGLEDLDRICGGRE